VARDQAALHAFLRRRLVGDPSVQVLLDRRLGERRRLRKRRQPERRWTNRRRPVGFDRDLRFHWVAVCREHRRLPRAGDLGDSETQGGRQVGMSMTESGASEARQQIERWIEESQLLLGRTIPSVLEDNQRLRDKTFAAEEDCDRMREEIAGLRRELGALQSELEALRGQHEYLRGERASVGESLTRAVHHLSQMMQPINEMVAKLNVTQSLAIEEGAYR
jgi:hypothetical protein